MIACRSVLLPAVLAASACARLQAAGPTAARECGAAVQEPIAGQPPAFEIDLRNGDRLSGDAVSLGDGVLVLHAGSNEYRIAWPEVARFASRKSVVVALRDGAVIPGTIEGDAPGWVTVRGGEGEARVVVLREIAALNPPQPKAISERDRWSGTFTLGGTVRRGNAESISANSRFDAVRRGDQDRIAFKGGWDYIESKDVLTDRRTNGEGKYEYFFAEKVFAFTSHRLERSLAQRLTLRYTGGAGGGYQFIESKPLELLADVSLAYVDEDYENDRTVSPPRSQDHEYMAGRATGKLVWRVDKTLSLSQELSALSSLERGSDVNLRSDTLLTVNVAKGFGLTFSFVVEHDNTPARGRERMDMLLNAGVAYSF